MNVIYMDNNATTRVSDAVMEAMRPYFTELYGNPSSMHAFGGQVGQNISAARKNVADLIGAAPGEIIFTGSGTESDNTAIYAALQSDNTAIYAALRSKPDKRHIITSRVEHPAVKNLLEDLSKNGYRVTWVPVDRYGMLDMDYLYDHLTDDTAIVSLMWANNETGVIFPIADIARTLRSRGIVFHTDAVQAAGKIPVDVNQAGVDMLSLSGHKIHAPKGIGALYVRKGTRFSPFLIGGHQERGRRGGTENTPAMIGLGKAAELARRHLSEDMNRVAMLRDKLETAVLNNTDNVMLNGHKQNRLPNTFSVSFEYVEGEAILLMLDQLGICASSGSACTSGSLEPSHVLRAMGVPFTAAHGSIRFSLGVYNTDAEVDFVVENLPPVIERLRQMSPFWKRGACQPQ